MESGVLGRRKGRRLGNIVRGWAKASRMRGSPGGAKWGEVGVVSESPVN